MGNPEQNEAMEKKLSPLHTVTPFSKYLALGLFIILPFLGGWIGYTYAPEKIVEIEKVVVREIPITHTNNDGNSSNINKNTTDETSFSSHDFYGSLDKDTSDTLFIENEYHQNQYAEEIRLSIFGSSTTLVHLEFQIDKNGLYLEGETIFSTTEDDYEYFGDGYFELNGKIYGINRIPFSYYGNQLLLLKSANIDMFLVLNNGYAVSDKDVYFEGVKIYQLQAGTAFETTNINYDAIGSAHPAGSLPFGVSGQDVFLFGELLNDISPSEIQVSDGALYIQDNDTVYLRKTDCGPIKYEKGEFSDIERVTKWWNSNC